MKQNTFSFLGTLIFLVLLSVSFISALSVSGSNSLSVTQGSSNSLVLTLSNSDGDDIVSANVSSSIPSSVSYTVNSSNFQVNNGSSKQVSLTYSANIATSVATTPQTLTINYLYQNGTVASKTHSLSLIINAASTNFCDFGNIGSNLSLKFDIDNKGEGDNEDWYLLDEIEIEVEVSNDGNKRAEDVQVEIAIFSGSEDVTDDFDLEDEKIDLGNIKEDDDEVITFVINNIPADMAEGSYTVKIKAYPKGDENLECQQESESVEVSNPFGEGVIPYNGVIGELVEANAGELVYDLSFDLINLGTDKEEEVLVNIYNKELGINENININDLRDGDSETIYFNNILIPSNVASKNYKVEVTTYFDYDDGDVLEEISYDENSEDDLDEDYNTFYFTIKVLGGNMQNNSQVKPTITATLVSDAKMNEELVVEVSVTNNVETAQFIISADNYGSWAALKSIEPSVLSITKYESEKSTLTLVPTSQGQKTFVIKVVSNGQVYEQPVTVSIENDSGLFSGLSAKFGNTTSYLIFGIVVLVVLIILILVIKALTSSSKRSRDDD
jgi:hypothetical protein